MGVTPSSRRRLAQKATAISFENEWLDLAALAALEQEGVVFIPRLESLADLVCKRRQRQLLERLHLPSPRWFPLEQLLTPPPAAELEDSPLAGAEEPAGEAAEPELPLPPQLPQGFDFPLMAKAVRGGYDGRGTRVIRSQAELEALIEAVDPSLWLLEELGLEHRIEKYSRDPKTNLAPPELLAIHPLGKSPVMQDGDLILPESGAIIEYLLERYGEGRLAPRLGTPERVRYLYWMHFAEGTMMLHLVSRLYLTRVGEAAKAMQERVEVMIKKELDLVENELGRSAHLAGEDFSAADIQMAFPLEFAAYARLVGEQHGKVRAYLARMQARPAYRRAIETGGTYAFDGTGT